VKQNECSRGTFLLGKIWICLTPANRFLSAKRSLSQDRREGNRKRKTGEEKEKGIEEKKYIHITIS
jgi:hypothetical protein